MDQEFHDPIPRNPFALLTQREAAEALLAGGHPTAAHVLTMNQDSPAYRVWNGVRLYCWNDLLLWAESLTAPLPRETA